MQENRYDAEGLHFELLENGRRTRFVYHDGELLHEEGREENQTSYHLGLGIDGFLRGQELSYYHRDEQLSTALVTDSNGGIQNSFQYGAFGGEVEAAEQLPNRIRYTGQQYDDLTGQYCLRARYYNPVLGRFMQEDAYQGDGMNLYAYCANNPVTYYDPSGYKREHNAEGKCPSDAKNGGADGADGKGDSGSSIPVKVKTRASNGLDYQSNPKHTPGQPGNNPNAGIEPKNSLDLFEESVPSTTKPNQRYTYDETTGTLHRFFNDGNGTWHWSGSTNQGSNSLKGTDVPNDIKNTFGLPKKGW